MADRLEAFRTPIPLEDLDLAVHPQHGPVILVRVMGDWIALAVSDEEIESLQGRISDLQSGRLDPPPARMARIV